MAAEIEAAKQEIHVHVTGAHNHTHLLFALGGCIGESAVQHWTTYLMVDGNTGHAAIDAR